MKDMANDLMLKKNIFYFVFVVTIFIIDRVSKILIIKSSDLTDNFNIFITSFLNFNLIWNDGIAFGLFSFEESYIYNFITIIILTVIIFVFVMIIKSEGVKHYSLLIIFSGAIGNLYDRISYKAVPDFIDVHIGEFHWFIFNIADIFITLGVLCLIYDEIFLEKKRDENNF